MVNHIVSLDSNGIIPFSLRRRPNMARPFGAHILKTVMFISGKFRIFLNFTVCYGSSQEPNADQGLGRIEDVYSKWRVVNQNIKGGVTPNTQARE